MQRILLFLYSLRAFLLFIFLEGVAIYMMVSYNSQQGAVFFNSSNKISGTILSYQNGVVEYFSLASVNKSLVDKNAELLAELEKLKTPADSMYIALDSTFMNTFQFKGAKVINNSLRFARNHITLNKGGDQGVKEGMGVFNEDGVVGRVKGVSKNFATVISLLHTDLLISSKVKSTDVFGTTKWDGLDSKKAKLMYIPRHVDIKVGDEVITSGYNAIFPEGIPIGKVLEVNPGLDNNYLDITLDLATDFSKISYVYLVENHIETELDSLYNATGVTNE
jgi:rod shape-determining protein MreC